MSCITSAPSRDCFVMNIGQRLFSSAAFSSGEVSLRKLPPPISGPARYFNRLGRPEWRMKFDMKMKSACDRRRLSGALMQGASHMGNGICHKIVKPD